MKRWFKIISLQALLITTLSAASSKDVLEEAASFAENVDTTHTFEQHITELITLKERVSKEKDEIFVYSSQKLPAEEIDSLTQRMYSLSMLESFLRLIAFPEMEQKYCESAQITMSKRYTANPKEELDKLPREGQWVYSIVEAIDR